MMSGSINHKCGVVAFARLDGKKGVLEPLELMSHKSEKRGGDGGGFGTYCSEWEEDTLKVLKSGGSVETLFGIEGISEYEGERGVGHRSYPTTGQEETSAEKANRNRQPELVPNRKRERHFMLGWNGTLANLWELTEELASGRYFKRETDTAALTSHLDIILHSYEEIGVSDLANAFTTLSKKLDGAYSFTFMDGLGRIAIGRDPYGFGPLWYAMNKDFFAAASEDVALNVLRLFRRDEMKEVKPGELIILDEKGNLIPFENALHYPGGIPISPLSPKYAHCMFEFVYFSEASSKENGISVDEVRENLGKRLAYSDPLRKKFESGDLNREEFVVIPVPDTGRQATLAYADALDVKLREGLIKGTSRAFTKPEGKRAKAMEIKFDILPRHLNGKNIILVDDSVVRGTTSRDYIVGRIKEESDPLSIHFRSNCPPILWSCFYRIDFQRHQLIAAKYDHLPPDELVEKVALEIGADSMHYQTLDGLVKALVDASHGTKTEKDFCLACLNGKYPTETGQELHELEVRGKLRGGRLIELPRRN